MSHPLDIDAEHLARLIAETELRLIPQMLPEVRSNYVEWEGIDKRVRELRVAVARVVLEEIRNKI